VSVEPGERSGTRTFLILWFGQLISLIGSGLTSFALGVYFYQRTGAASQLALSMVAASLPNLLLPFAGALVDRWDRQRVLVLSETGAALITLTFGRCWPPGDWRCGTSTPATPSPRRWAPSTGPPTCPSPRCWCPRSSSVVRAG